MPLASRRLVEGDVGSFVEEQVRGMPAHLRLPYRAALWAFQWMALRQYGRPYTLLDPVKQRDYISVWIHSTVGFKRDFIKLMRSCALLQYYDHPEVETHLVAWSAHGESTDAGGGI